MKYNRAIMNDLTIAQRKYLKAQAHNRKPVVTIGNKGLTPAVLEELDASLNHHELIKVKLPAGEKSARSALAASLCEQSNAALVTVIGRIAVIFRELEPSSFSLPR